MTKAFMNFMDCRRQSLELSRFCVYVGVIYIRFEVCDIVW